MARAQDFLQRYSATVRRLVDLENTRVLSSRDWLTPFAPVNRYIDYELLLLKLKRNKAIAHYVGFAGEIPESKGGELRRADLTILKVGASHIMDEDDMKLLRKWQNHVQGVPDEVRDQFFGNVTGLIDRNIDAHTVLFTQAMSTGKVQYADPVTKLRVNTTYNDDPDAFPADLTATPDANGEVEWTDTVNAKPIEGQRRHYRRYRGIGKPDATVMNEETYDAMVDTAEFRRQVAARNSVDASTADSFVVSMADAEEVYRVNGLPPLAVVDSMWEEEQPNGDLNEKFFIETGRYVFGWNGNGERALGPVESNDGRPGVYTFTEEKSKEPPIDRAVGVSTGAPMIADTRKMGGRRVYAA